MELRHDTTVLAPMRSVPYLARLLLDGEADLGVMRMRTMKQVFKVLPGNETPFLGPAVILVDSGTASTSEIFAQALLDLGRVTIVSSESSMGAALPSLMENLDDGGLLQYVVADYVSPKGVKVEGRGVGASVPVELSQKAYAEGHDPVLEAGIATLRSEISQDQGQKTANKAP